MPLVKTKRNPVVESDTIVALLDTGIEVDVPSFNDKGFGHPPSKWKGECETGMDFAGCNNKVIGARVYLQDDGGYEEMVTTPADYEGHGTHTASTAAGSIVKGSSFYGMAKGAARGGVPGARIAMYKVCGSGGCPDQALLAGFDDAIADGADVISVSIGSQYGLPFLSDPIAIGSFHAMQKGVLVVSAAGNDGPKKVTLSNFAPWMLIVAASNIDREFRTRVKLGNGFKFYGRSINTFAPNKTMYPLISGMLACDPRFDPWFGRTCDLNYILPEKVKGKVLFCDGHIYDDDALQLGVYGAIGAYTPDYVDVPDLTRLPETPASARTGNVVERYINETKDPIAVFQKSITRKVDAPFVASFSSRGPQFFAPNILKPDIIAPGLAILAGFSKHPSLTDDDMDDRHMVFNVLSGTSMATPHVAGGAAYVKTFHPDWSSAAIMSALMTTAKPMYVEGVEYPFNSGSGLLNPTAAIDPGLIYNMSFSSHISYLCSHGYNSTMLGTFTGGKFGPNCTDYPKAKGLDGINYPTMHFQFWQGVGLKGNFSGIFYRTVTSVTPGKSTYKAIVHESKQISVKVVPDILVFHKIHEEKSFKVMVSGTLDNTGDWVSTALEWNDGRHKVRTPIVIYRKTIFDIDSSPIYDPRV
ncbi:hypothetical protein Droror1_Dr00026301 [Drosera rotundifolia]